MIFQLSGRRCVVCGFRAFRGCRVVSSYVWGWLAQGQGQVGGGTDRMRDFLSTLG